MIDATVGPVSLSQLKTFSRIVFERAKNRAVRIPNGGGKYWKYLSLDNKLLDDLEGTAPGTLRHNIMLANIVGAAAFHVIGANPDFARCVALFHDIFKGKYPHLFFEARSGLRGFNSRHRKQIEVKTLDDLNIIMSHANESARILGAHEFPQEVCQAVSEHHGNMATLVHLSPNLQKILARPEMQRKYLRYSGPRPTSKESAIVMLADRCEAVLNRKSTETGWPVHPSYGLITLWVKDLCADVRSKGQLENSGLSVEEQAIVEYKIAWWLYRFYNNLDVTGTPSTQDLLELEGSRRNH